LCRQRFKIDKNFKIPYKNTSVIILHLEYLWHLYGFLSLTVQLLFFFFTVEVEPGLLHHRQVLYHLNHTLRCRATQHICSDSRWNTTKVKAVFSLKSLDCIVLRSKFYCLILQIIVLKLLTKLISFNLICFKKCHCSVKYLLYCS
jgi:hypothetical protein